jgi:isoleucyl-tRNA synthetase
MPKVKQALIDADGSQLLAQMEADGKIVLDIDDQSVELDSEDVQVRLQAKEGWAAAQGPNCVVVLSTELTPQLLREGMARDLVRLIQERRKELDCQFTDRIRVGIVTDSDEVQTAVNENTEYIKGETLAVDLVAGSLEGAVGAQYTVAGNEVVVYVIVVPRD